MQIKKGKDRIVVLLPLLGVVVKFPMSHIWRVGKLAMYSIRKGKWKRVWDDFWLPMNISFSFRTFLFRGIVENWREYQFYRQTHHPFVQPTYASFFGIFNIQQYGEPCTLEVGNLLEQLCALTNGEAYADAHHFAHPQNFCFYNGKLRILDYGGLTCQGVIERHGLRITEQFNPAYSCKTEFEKKQRAVQKSETN